MRALIDVMIGLASLSGWLTCARMLYGRWRPATEPLYCRTPHTCAIHPHYDSCYRRSIYGSGDTEARIFALITGLLWPVFLPLMAAAWLISRNPPPRADETAAKIKRLEQEMRIGP